MSGMMRRLMLQAESGCDQTAVTSKQKLQFQAEPFVFRQNFFESAEKSMNLMISRIRDH